MILHMLKCKVLFCFVLFLQEDVANSIHIYLWQLSLCHHSLLFYLIFLPFYVTLCIHHRSKRRFTFISPELYLHVLECLSLCLLLSDSSFHSAPLALIRIRPAPLHTYCYNIYYYYILYGIPLYLSVLLSDWERIFSMH